MVTQPAVNKSRDMGGLSLKARLSWLIAFVLFLILIANIAILVGHAGPRVRTEAENIEHLARELVTMALARLQDSKDPLPALQRMFESKLRHVQIQFLSGNDPSPVMAPHPSAEQDTNIPHWFVALVAPAPKVTLVPAVINGLRYGNIAIASYPADEAAEVWSDMVSLAQTSLVATLLVLAVVLFLLRRSLSPLDALEQGLARLEEGRPNVRLFLNGAREFNLIATRLNSLATTLDRVRGENQALLEKLIKVQDDERRGIARDLHDEAGPCLFAIRASASTLSEAMSDSKLNAGMRKAIRDIQSAGQALQDVVRRMLDQLRPPGLTELGLEAALRSLVANWQGARSDLLLTVETPHDLCCLDEAVALTAYRVVQESLTNVYRHSSATWARVRLAFEQEPAAEDAATTTESAAPSLRITIEDDGVGLTGESGKGRGLVGMRERVKALSGRICISDGVDGGTRIDVQLPARARDESAA